MLITWLSKYIPTFIRRVLTLMHLGLYICCSPSLLLSHLLPPRSDSPDLVRGAGTDLACGTTSVEELLWQNCFQKLSREWNVLIWLTFSQIRKRPCGAVCLAGNKNPISFLPYLLRQSWDFNSFSTQLSCTAEELHPTSAVTDVLYYYSWMFLLGLKQKKQCLWFPWTEMWKHKKLSHISLILGKLIFP